MKIKILHYRHLSASFPCRGWVDYFAAAAAASSFSNIWQTLELLKNGRLHSGGRVMSVA
jgi:hypothetical protein